MKTGAIVRSGMNMRTAVNEMLKKTSTTFAPWHILESVDKKYARIKASKNRY